VYVLILNPDQATEEHGEEPGADIALFLARHGIKIEIATRFTKTDIAESILQVAKENSCDLLVMGGYGHTRFREMIMGGTTKTILEKMNLPVLMSH
jgi:nucleotide-binding universal stress UspA family protein